MTKKHFIWPLLFSFLGILDAGYLTFYSDSVLTSSFCSINSFTNCFNVLNSRFAYLGNMSVASIGLIHYSVLALTIIFTKLFEKKFWKYLSLILGTVGFIASLYFLFLQFVILKNICFFCIASELISFILFFLFNFIFKKERKELFIYLCDLLYKALIRPILFKFDSEKIHEALVSQGEKMTKSPPLKNIIKKSVHFFTRYDDSILKQKYLGISFENPFGLAAGFDYDAKLTQLLPILNFGFGTCGTITNMPYEGNPPPRLGRLVKSKSLLVNKGFKSSGADAIIKKLQHLTFEIPIGISIGRTNSPLLKTQKQSIEDIISAFKKFEKARIENSYYELNISCPNLIYGETISFYPPQNLQELLLALTDLKISKPIFIKMPISESDDAILKMLKVSSQFSFVKGVILGNLQTNRHHPSINQEEAKKYVRGKFSGKPCFERSNELISLAYKHFKKRFIIIGCGGVFSAQDAYEKIKRGASLIQLITGLIFEGPQLISKLNLNLIDLLKKDGFKNVSEAIGSKSC